MNCGIAMVQECVEDSRKAVSRSTWAWQPYDQSPPLPFPRDGIVKGSLASLCLTFPICTRWGMVLPSTS